MTLAALIKCVYEAMHRACRGVAPLKCPKRALSFVEGCGGMMKIISFIDQDEIIERILKHCGLWKDPLRSRESEARPQPRPPPEICMKIPSSEDPLPDYTPPQADSRIFHHTIIEGLRQARWRSLLYFLVFDAWKGYFLDEEAEFGCGERDARARLALPALPARQAATRGGGLYRKPETGTPCRRQEKPMRTEKSKFHNIYQ